MTAASAAERAAARSSRPSLLALMMTASSSSSSSSTSTSTTTTQEGGGTAASSPASTSAMTPPPRVKTAHCNADDRVGQRVTIKGWVRTVRKQKTLAFLNVNDGSNVAGIQVVVNLDELVDEQSRHDVNALTTGAAVSIVGTLVESPKQGQNVELQASRVELVGPCPSDTYPLAKKRHSLEYLRSIAHLRPRTNTIAAVARVRSQLAYAIHQFFQQQGFVYVHTPLITASDCEGAGEMFRVTTLDLNDVDKLPRAKMDDNNKDNKDGALAPSVDYKKDFFGKPAYLTVSGQLGGETHACALGDIYTFGPTFRAENSQTTRHLAEFHMVEPELAFCDLDGAMDNAEQLVKSVVQHVLDNCQEDLQFFQKFFDPNLVQRLQDLVQEPFVRIPYRDAIAYLQEEIKKDPAKWQFPTVEFGTDLATEHERWLAETKFNTAVFVYNYPKQIKAFYMRDNDPETDASEGKKTVAAMDLLVPGVGELIGGSQREDRLDVLLKKLEEQGLDSEDYWWYLDLRRFGSVPHAGYGLGFERLVTYVTGIDNIREAIAFPRYPGNAEF
jgi:asparaginyl-tRNA synthetase